MITMMKIMLKIKIKKIFEKIESMWMIILNNSNYNNNKWNTYNRQNTYSGREKKQTKNNTYLLHPNYEKTSLSNMRRKDDAR